MSHGTPTRAPGGNRPAPAPAASTVPTIWCPGIGQLAVDDVQVGATDTAGGDTHEHLARPRGGNREIDQPQGSPRRIQQ